MCLWYVWMVSWIVNVCAGGSWISEWSVDGMNVIVLHGLRAATHIENWTVPVYYDRSVWDWEGDKREKTGIKSVHLEDCIRLWLAWMDGKDTNNKRPTVHFPTTLQTLWAFAVTLNLNWANQSSPTHPQKNNNRLWLFTMYCHMKRDCKNISNSVS